MHKSASVRRWAGRMLLSINEFLLAACGFLQCPRSA